MIKLQVIGHLGKDCMMNNVNGKTVMNFTVAHSEKFKNSQGVQQDKTIWVDCAYWSDRTGIAPYLKKGTLVYVEGQPEVRTFTNREGQAGASLTLRVSNVQLLGNKSDNQGGEQGGGTAYQNQGSNSYNQPANNYQPAQQPTPAAAEVSEPMDDLPF